MTREITGKYFGTEINEKWWRRYKKNKMLARGNGTLSYDEQSITFLRYLTNVPIVIEFEKIIEFKVGKWHAGQWGVGTPIIKVLWKNDNKLLSSGFSVSKRSAEIETVVSELNRILWQEKYK